MSTTVHPAVVSWSRNVPRTSHAVATRACTVPNGYYVCYVAWHDNNTQSHGGGFSDDLRVQSRPRLFAAPNKETLVSFGVENSRALVVETLYGSRGPVTPFCLPPFASRLGLAPMGHPQRHNQPDNSSCQISQAKHEVPDYYSEQMPTAQRSSSDAIRCSVIANLKQPNTDHQARGRSSTKRNCQRRSPPPNLTLRWTGQRRDTELIYNGVCQTR